MTLAPIVLFVYNRIEHTKKTIEALQKNTLANQSELFIYSDASKDKINNTKVKIIRDYINIKKENRKTDCHLSFYLWLA